MYMSISFDDTFAPNFESHPDHLTHTLKLVLKYLPSSLAARNAEPLKATTNLQQKNLKILRDCIRLCEANDDVKLELHSEPRRDDGGTREQSRKHHVDRNRHPSTHVSVAYLQVLNLGGLSQLTLQLSQEDITGECQRDGTGSGVESRLMWS